MLLKGVDKIYVINLKRRPERLAQFFATCPIDHTLITVFEAVDGTLLTGAEPEIRGIIKNREKYQRGILGAFMSHCAILRDIVENNYTGAIVFEDDNMWWHDYDDKDAFMQQWNELILPVIPGNVDILYFDHAQFYTPQSPSVSDVKFQHPKKFVTGTVPVGKWGMYSYYVTLKGAQRILDSFADRPAVRSVDDEIAWLRHAEFNLQWLCPPLCHSPVAGKEGHPSDIQFDQVMTHIQHPQATRVQRVLSVRYGVLDSGDWLDVTTYVQAKHYHNVEEGTLEFDVTNDTMGNVDPAPGRRKQARVQWLDEHGAQHTQFQWEFIRFLAK